MSTKLNLKHMKHLKEYKACAESTWSEYLLCQQLTGCKDWHLSEENHEVPKGKTKWDVENLHAVRQKAENVVEDNLLGSDLKFGMVKCSGRISINLC